MSSAYLFSILATAAIFVLLALSLNIITGYAGQAMMGIAAFFGIGAYTAAIVTTHGGNFWLALLAGIIVSGIFGAVLGVISMRLQADFLAITTIGINFVMVAVFNQLKITGGTLGLTTQKPVLFGIKFNNMYFFILTVIIIVIVCLLIVKMRKSWFGMALASIENDPGAARSFGINVNKYQILAFIIGTCLAGLAGGIYAHRMGFISSSDFAFVVSIQVVSMVVIGGIGTIRGPIFGALLITILPEVLRFADNYRELVYAALLVIMVRFMPQGLLGDTSPIWMFLVKLFRKIVPRKKTRADLITEAAVQAEEKWSAPTPEQVPEAAAVQEGGLEQ
ncbi:MAG: branched-chain amino acid ABC transporter permease [Firmicutes bacterium]|nr:branched-chain amino acid ABC transporter permease [Bacillota bacterium]